VIRERIGVSQDRPPGAARSIVFLGEELAEQRVHPQDPEQAVRHPERLYALGFTESGNRDLLAVPQRAEDIRFINASHLLRCRVWEERPYGTQPGSSDACRIQLVMSDVPRKKATLTYFVKQ
jgi:hypothetical protein